jgi:hypothetical protein
MKIKVYAEVPAGKRCMSRAPECRKCKWHYDSVPMCTIFDEPVESFQKCEKCKNAEVVK